MEGVVAELLAHRGQGDAEPARGLGLIAIGQFDGVAQGFLFHLGLEDFQGIIDLAPAGRLDRVGDEFLPGDRAGR